MSDEIDKIRERHNLDKHDRQFDALSGMWCNIGCPQANADRATLLTALDAERTARLAAEAALKPFADFASEWDDEEGRYGKQWPDEEWAYDPVVRIEIGAFRRARAALAALETKP